MHNARCKIKSAGFEVMVVRIVRPIDGGEIRAVPSKSYAHRLLICAALADGETLIECGAASDDIEATVSCLEGIGARIGYDGAVFKVGPTTLAERALPAHTLSAHTHFSRGNSVIQNCGESGSTLRFMLPVCCALGIPAEFVMKGRLPERPVAPLLEQLALHGCEISASEGGLRVQGKLRSGVFELPGNVSSQFVSGLLFALPLLEGDSEIFVEGKEESAPYIDMTLDTVKSFGIDAKRREGYYRIDGGRGYSTTGTARVEGDWSNAAFWLCAGAAGGRGVTCTGLNTRSRQGDMAVIEVLERFGAAVSCIGDSVTVKPARLGGIRIDAGDIPDLVPVLSVVAAAAQGETEIYNAGRLRIKESDRLRAVTETLRALGADISELEDGLLIRGNGALRGGKVSSFGDHRVAMMAATASVLCEGPVEISGAESVNKSYPGFFKDFVTLGGTYQVK